MSSNVTAPTFRSLPAAPPAVPADWPVDAGLLAALLTEQHPTFAGLPIRPMGEGWDNAVFLVGEDLVCRLPRRAAAIPLMENELRWMGQLGPRLPLPTSAPCLEGRPSARFGAPWSGARLIRGQTADRCPAEPSAATLALSAFLRALHQPAPPEAPINPVRGIRAHQRRPTVERLAGIAPPGLLDRWAGWSSRPAPPGPPRWCHGDLHPRNLIVQEGQLVGVIDWGDLTAGWPAVDLGAALLGLPQAHWSAFFAAYAEGATLPDETVAESLAWTTVFALLLYDAGLSAADPFFRTLGEAALAGLMADPIGAALAKAP